MSAFVCKSVRGFMCFVGLAAVTFTGAQGYAAAVQSMDKKPTEAVVTLDSGQLVLRPLTDGAIRVRVSDGKTAETPSFVLVGKTPTPKFEVRESGDSITVSTGKMQAVVDRASGALSFKDAAGKVFLKEKLGTRSLKPSTIQGVPNFVIEQGFESPADEQLFGLGQYQDGLWNWRGIPIELRQLNTQIAVPVLMSNKGYGLLWDNASRTDFNLPGTAIALSTDSKTSDSATQGPTATEQLSAAPAKPAKPASIRYGSFTSGAAGEYVFCTRDGDRSKEIMIEVDGKQIAGLVNMWVPRAIVGKVTLAANKQCAVTVRGGGKDVKLFARPVATDSTFHSDCAEAIDYTVFYGPKMDEVIAGYRATTGQAPMWPKWAYGFWQCRERYSSEKQILDTVAEFRNRQIPIDLIVQDWQYWGKYGWGAYQWDEKYYPHPAEMIKSLHEQNVKFMISIWCNPSGKLGQELDKEKLKVKSWMDIFNPKAREIRWKHTNENFFSIGADAWWGDATEPGDPGDEILEKKCSMGIADRVTSAYPLFASQSLYEGQRGTDPNKRVCILTRSAFPGMQRYAAAAWSGDINGTWDTFKRQIPAGLNFCLTGQPYWTTDCGGFFRPGNGQYKSSDYNELLTRWFQWSTFCPILRVHGYGTKTEMWEWLPETQKNMLAYDKLRYRMLPYNYSVAWKVTNEAYTIMRPLAMDFPNDAKAWNISDSYLFGPAFLVAPVTQAKAVDRAVYLPSGTKWVNFWTGETQEGGKTITTPAPIETLPLFARAGSIVPFGPDVQYAMEKSDPIELRIYPGADGTFTLYEDQGDNYDYEKGAYATIPLTWNDKTRTLTLGARKGQFPGMAAQHTFRVVLVAPGQGVGMGAAEKATEVSYSGSSTTTRF
ncbi:TPA: glycosyl hydrolase family 31 [Candidatus Sumerlaeota bacterium]|jgi:alpha-D-xyloside xylohydrolase|nr:glycosyl hydrolase family 31 [Candidatus Sumerlaeota bacterium]